MSGLSCTGIEPFNSIVRYEMQRRASNSNGAVMAAVGQAEIQRAQEPHRFCSGSSCASHCRKRPAEAGGLAVVKRQSSNPSSCARCRMASFIDEPLAPCETDESLGLRFLVLTLFPHSRARPPADNMAHEL